MSGNDLGSVINNENLVGFPHLLGYKVNKTCSEIMMTHGGNCISKWSKKFNDHRERANFAAEMLRQTIIALKTLHGLGYSHGDLKQENICVR
jgi:serine/threonine protein kinase